MSYNNYVIQGGLRKMAVVKNKRKKNNYLQIDRQSIEDKKLSWGATGLLTYLIGKPEDWEIRLNQLTNAKSNGRDGIRKLLNELRKFNYCHYFEIREKGKVKETIYLVFENPISYEMAKKEIEILEGEEIYYKEFREKKGENIFIPKTEKTVSDKSITDNTTQLIIDSNNNILTNNKTTTDTFFNLEKSSSYEFLDFEYFSLLNSKTKLNICNNVKNLSKERFEKIYTFVEKKYSKGEVKNFNAFLYKALVENWDISLDEKNIKKELNKEKKKWLNRYSGVMNDPVLKEEIEGIIFDIPLDLLEKNKSKLGTLSLFDFKQHLYILKKQSISS